MVLNLNLGLGMWLGRISSEIKSGIEKLLLKRNLVTFQITFKHGTQTPPPSVHACPFAYLVSTMVYNTVDDGRRRRRILSH